MKKTADILPFPVQRLTNCPEGYFLHWCKVLERVEPIENGDVCALCDATQPEGDEDD